MGKKWKLHGCPRCHGDVFVERDEYGWYEQCLQCAYRRELSGVYEPSKVAAEGDEKVLVGKKPGQGRR